MTFSRRQLMPTVRNLILRNSVLFFLKNGAHWYNKHMYSQTELC